MITSYLVNSIHWFLRYDDRSNIPCNSLEASISSGSSPKELDASILEKYALGPLTQAVLWEGGRATMALDRGPCK
jgi:hypothetical protein